MNIKKILAFAVTGIMAVSPVAGVFAMDKARVETRTDEAVNAFGVSGEGVLVAILDRGIDWKSNDFRNEDGTTRIKYIFDLSDNSGANAPGNTYGVGTIYTEAQINAALTGGPQLATRDAVGHGTTTTAIAAGNGRNLPDRRYRGVAPKASIISVKFTSEGAPAHGDQPAEAAFYNENNIVPALNFVKDKAAELGMPVVILPNFGTINGPTDGTSFFSRTIDATVGPGKSGIAFVMGTGDDGGAPNHAGGVIQQGETRNIRIEKTTAGTLRLDLWYPGDDRFTVSMNTPSGSFGPYAPPANNDRTTVTNGTFYFYHNGTQTVFYGAQNGKREIFMDIIGPVGTYTLTLTGTTVTNGRFDGTLNPSRMSMTGNRFLDDVVPGSIIDQATAHYNIAPNSYVGEVNWTDINGINRTITGQGNIGELWLGSSVGHSFDGRRIVDLSAPGDLVITSYSPTSYWATATGNLVFGGNGLYGRAGAVSAAAPQVVGVVALMLERNPLLDAVQIKRILQISSRPDAFTGPTPNPEWGYGKMDAYRAVELAAVTNISGQARNSDGRPLPQTVVTLTDQSGAVRRSVTNGFGYYSFDGLTLGGSYTITATSRTTQFAPVELTVTGMMTDIDLVPQTVPLREKGPDKAAVRR
ncbi:MAG: S8 family serine peptidase [Acidobacteria bacterium]|nr:S8 family serine peptidase [Acidobacteriota bacterium]